MLSTAVEVVEAALEEAAVVQEGHLISAESWVDREQLSRWSLVVSH